MKAKLKLIPLFLVAVLLSGCMLTVDEMYCLPKRSETYNDLQSAIDVAMDDLAFCAPLSGENQQTVQLADLDGDSRNEYLLFAKSEQEDKPLRILVFQNVDGTFVNIDTVECNGHAFDQVEYVDMNGDGGLEVLVGRQLSDQLIRAVSVYSFVGKELMQLTTVNYSKFLTADLNADGRSEMFVLRPGQTESDRGVAELYRMDGENIERYNEVTMSQPVDKLKRILLGKIDGEIPAVYTASAVGETALITDVYIVADEVLVNIGLTKGSDTSVQTMRNFYIYANDIDGDTVVELPRLMTMSPNQMGTGLNSNQLICWYAMTATGEEIIKMYTYHNFVGGWYMQLSRKWAERATVTVRGNEYVFSVLGENGSDIVKLFTVYALSVHNRDDKDSEEKLIELYRTDTLVYALKLEECADEYGLDEQIIKDSFRLIQQDWKTGET